MAHVSRYHGLREFKKRETHRRSDTVFSELERATGNPKSGVEQDLDELGKTAYLRIIGGRARADEAEADLYGVAYAAAAGYEPDAFADVLARIDREKAGMEDQFRHHPAIGERLAAIEEGIAKHHFRAAGQKRLQERFARETSQREGVPQSVRPPADK
jgi:predicted Zn-dependent protease